MSQTVSGEGRLRHQFHGTYSAVIVLAFASPDHARDALVALGAPWKVASSEPRALVACLSSDDLDAFKAAHAHAFTIAPCGRRGCRGQCKDATIDSIAHSIDYGPTFTVDIRTSPTEQTALFGAP